MSPPLQAAEKEVSNLEKQLSQATKHQEKLAAQAQDARAAQKAAEQKVSQAGLEASNARKLVEAVSLHPCIIHPVTTNQY